MIVVSIIITVVLVLSACFIAFLNTLGVPTFLGVLICIGIVALGLYLFNKWADSGEPSEREITIEYDVETGSAKLYKRTGENLKGMTIQQYKNIETSYVASKTVYTGANVGGVVTGGFHQTPAYLKETSRGGAGKYYLWVKTPSKTEIFENDYMILKRIILADELVDEAKNDKRVKKFLHGKELILSHSATVDKTDAQSLKSALDTNHYAMTENVVQKIGLQSALSWQECYDIKDWISGDVVKNKPKKSDTKKEKESNKNTEKNSGASNKSNQRKHPSKCVYRDKNTTVCSCEQSSKCNTICNSTANCKYYEENTK